MRACLPGAILAGMKKFTPIVLVLSFLAAWCAHAEQPLGEVAFRQALRDIGTDLRLMCVAAHPDDEDGATLALYRMAYGLDTYALIATRGEGGQNEIGPELGHALGVIRTREMQRASQITGAHLRFLDMPEFGYSKSIEETYAVWGEEETLRRLVRQIREIRPDVIITHHGKQKDHGHHQAVGRSLIEAFDAAADPTMFPEQIAEGLAPWQAARLYIRTFEQTPDAVAVPIGAFDPLRGVAYTEVAAQALEQHASQGMGFFIDRFIRGQQFAWYELEKAAQGGVSGAAGVPAPKASLLDGLYDRVAPEARMLSERADQVTREEALAAFAAHGDEDDWQRLGAVAAGIDLHATVNDAVAVPGQTITIHATLHDYGVPDLKDLAATVLPAPTFDIEVPSSQAIVLDDTNTAAAEFTVAIPRDEAPTLPLAEHLFDAGSLMPPIEVEVTATLGGAPFRLRAPVDVQIALPVELTFLDAPYLARLNADVSTIVTLDVINRTAGPAHASVALSAAAGLNVPSREEAFELPQEEARTVWAIPASSGKDPPLQPRDYLLTALAGDHAVHAPVRLVDLAVPESVRVGVVQSYDDTYVTTLRKMGVPHETLTEKDFNPIALDTYTTIIVDIRAYMVRPDLVANNKALLDYVNRGGTLIVNYQKTFEWKPEYAPYPIHLSRNRVTDENASVTLLVPGHPLFHAPNEIVDRDWEGWIQERGLYFPDQWDEHYTPLLAMNDPGEDIPPGSLLVASYGDGHYIYTALGWYRQLRELHPGALRMFANMLNAPAWD